MESRKDLGEQLGVWAREIGPALVVGFVATSLVGLISAFVWRPTVAVLMFLLVAAVMMFHQRYYILQLMLGILAVEVILFFLFSDFLSPFVVQYQGSVVALNACGFLALAAYSFNLERLRPLFFVALLLVVLVVGYQLITFEVMP